MVRKYYGLPSLTSLAVFEACARHMNFKQAAGELNVTRGAISRQIKALEDEVGVELFLRNMDGIALTPEGETLYMVLAKGFSEVSEALHGIRMGQKNATVTLACSNAFATLWLMRRIGSFWHRHPEIMVDHLISDNAQELRKSQIDLRVRYGSGAWPDETTELLLRETIFPVSSPAYAAAIPDQSFDDLSQIHLLHVDGVDPDWTNWDEFLRRAGVPHGPLRGRRFNNFAVLLQAIEDGQGVALGWHQLVKHLVDEGRLQRFGDLEIAAPGAYYVTWNQNRRLSEAALTVKDWLIETAQADQTKTDPAD